MKDEIKSEKYTVVFESWEIKNGVPLPTGRIHINPTTLNTSKEAMQLALTANGEIFVHSFRTEKIDYPFAPLFGVVIDVEPLVPISENKFNILVSGWEKKPKYVAYCNLINQINNILTSAVGLIRKEILERKERLLSLEVVR